MVGLAMEKNDLHPLNQDAISFNIQGDVEVEVFETIDSTNDYLRQEALTTTKICLAEQQSQGRGQFSRTWHSPFGQNIYYSIRHFFNLEPKALGGFSLAIGVQVAQAIEQVLPSIGRLSLKWPNDILYQGKKLGGILVEMKTRANGGVVVIVGVGINVNMMHDNTKAEIDKPWTSLKEMTGQDCDRHELVVCLSNALLNGFEQFKQQGFQAFIDQWHQRDCLKDTSIQVISNGKCDQGMAQGVDRNGHLLMMASDGSSQIFMAGEASLHAIGG